MKTKIIKFFKLLLVFAMTLPVFADQVCTHWYWVTTYSDGSKTYDYIGTFCEYRDTSANAAEAGEQNEIGCVVPEMVEFLEISSGEYLKVKLWGFSGIGANTTLECSSSTATKKTIELGVDANLLNSKLGYEKSVTITSSAKFTTPKEAADYSLEGWFKCEWKKYHAKVTYPGGMSIEYPEELYGEKFKSFDFARFTNGERTNAW